MYREKDSRAENFDDFSFVLSSTVRSKIGA